MIVTVRLFAAACAVLAVSGIVTNVAAAPLAPAGAHAVRAAAPARPQLVQLFGQRDDSELVARMGRLENQIRQLTGMIEELQHRNNQLEQQLRRMQQDTEFRFEEMSPSGRGPAQRSQSGTEPPRSAPPPVASRRDAPIILPQETPSEGGRSDRRSDVFDPTTAPNAPGVPRTLGTIPAGPGGPAGGTGDASGTIDPSRRPPGTPLDLGSLAGTGPSGQRAAPGGADSSPREPGVGQQAVLAPSGSARDEYDLAYGAVLRRDYELAVDGFRTFLSHHANSREPEAQRLVPEAHYWLGESMFQLKQYNDAAEIFLKISTDYPNAVKAPDALLRLGQSLVQLGERETACASLGHVLTKYPKASATVRRAVEQEQQRARC